VSLRGVLAATGYRTSSPQSTADPKWNRPSFAALNRGKQPEGYNMSGVGIIGAIIIGILAGWIAEKVMKRNHGMLTNLIVGIVGALLGGFIAGALGINFGGWIGSLVVSTLGAILLLLILGAIKRR